MPKGSSCPELSCTVLPMQYSVVFLAQRTLLDHHPLPLIAVAGIRRSYAVILEDLHRSSRSSTLSRTCPDCTDLVISTLSNAKLGDVLYIQDNYQSNLCTSAPRCPRVYFCESEEVA